MVNSIFAASGVERITVCQERDTTQFPDHISHGFYIIWTKICTITKFAKVHFYRNKLSDHINFFKSCFNAKIFQLVQQTCSDFNSEIGKINFRFFVRFHKKISSPRLCRI